MSPPAAVASVFSNYVKFSGRASRSEYWWWTLFNGITPICLLAIGLFFKNGSVLDKICALAFFGYLVAAFLPNLAVTVRRLHDLDKSGWSYFIVFVPLLGVVLLLIWLCTPGTRGANRFGGGGGNFARAVPMPRPAGYS